jgi:DNA polymerase IV
MRPSNRGTTQACAAAPSRLATLPSAAWWQRRATRARKFGVRSAMPSSTALRRCPELIFVPPRFEVYRAVSRQIHGVFADYTPLIEPLSLDEAYLDVTENLRGIRTAAATAAEIRARIFEETALTASAGISYTPTL